MSDNDYDIEITDSGASKTVSVEVWTNKERRIYNDKRQTL